MPIDSVIEFEKFANQLRRRVKIISDIYLMTEFMKNLDLETRTARGYQGLESVKRLEKEAEEHQAALEQDYRRTKDQKIQRCLDKLPNIFLTLSIPKIEAHAVIATRLNDEVNDKTDIANKILLLDEAIKHIKLAWKIFHALPSLNKMTQHGIANIQHHLEFVQGNITVQSTIYANEKPDEAILAFFEAIEKAEMTALQDALLIAEKCQNKYIICYLNLSLSMLYLASCGKIHTEALCEKTYNDYLPKIALITEQCQQAIALLETGNVAVDEKLRRVGEATFILLFESCTAIHVSSLHHSINDDFDLRKTLLAYAALFLKQGRQLTRLFNLVTYSTENIFSTIQQDAKKLLNELELFIKKKKEAEEKLIADQKQKAQLALLMQEYENKFDEILAQFPTSTKPTSTPNKKVNNNISEPRSNANNEEEEWQNPILEEELYQTVFITFDEKTPPATLSTELNNGEILKQKQQAWLNAETDIKKIDAGFHIAEHCFLNAIVLLKKYRHYPENIAYGIEALQHAKSYLSSAIALLKQVDKTTQTTPEYQSLKEWIDDFHKRICSAIQFYSQKFEETAARFATTRQQAMNYMVKKYGEKAWFKNTNVFELSLNAKILNYTQHGFQALKNIDQQIQDLFSTGKPSNQPADNKINNKLNKKKPNHQQMLLKNDTTNSSHQATLFSSKTVTPSEETKQDASKKFKRNGFYRR